MIDELELSDIFLSNGLFTWSNGRERPFLSLIDCFLVNIEWMEKFWYSRASILNRITSDHFPIMLVTDNFSWGPMPFCFENMRFLEFFLSGVEEYKYPRLAWFCSIVQWHPKS